MGIEESSNSRGLIKSMLVIGSAQFLNVLISIVRIKVLAVLLGPSGVALLSIYNNLKGMATEAAGLGMGSSGVREIATMLGEEAALNRVRRVLSAAHLVQGSLAMVAVWVLRDRIATGLFGDTTRAAEVGLIGLAILLTLIGTAQTTVLQGLRRIGDLGRVTVLGAFASTVVGLAAVWLQGEGGLIWFILLQPLTTVLIARRYTGRLPKLATARLSLGESWKIWKPIARLGVSFMLGGLATTATLLLVRVRITEELGMEAAGFFAAAWGITITYVSFLLGAMGADYYPRLTAVIHDHVAAVRLMNLQAQLGLAIGGPILLLLIGFGPWVITLLYSADFGPAVTLLQWQALGNVFKLASWSMSFSIVAAARAKTFFFMELSFNIVFLTMVVILLPHIGLEVTAYAFVLGYLVYLTTVYVLARRIHGFRWEVLSLAFLCLHTGLALALLVLALTAPHAAAIASPLLAGAIGVFGMRSVLIKIGSHGRLATRLFRLYAAIGWPIRTEK